MKKSLTLLAFAIFTFVSGQNDKKTFQDLKQLEGKWVGTLNLSNGESKPMNLHYSIRSNGSALVEESNEGGTEMMTIINLHNDKILSTHYCGARNRPVAELKSNKNGIIKFVTNHKRSGLDVSKESFVGSWEFVITPNEKDKFTYKYTSIGPYSFEAVAKMNRVK
tara:strand:+ start:1498 stop:1992 length:495 start_codon:yes stop_codon:yes gene_type:complete